MLSLLSDEWKSLQLRVIILASWFIEKFIVDILDGRTNKVGVDY